MIDLCSPSLKRDSLRAWFKYLDDNEYRKLQRVLMDNPELEISFPAQAGYANFAGVRRDGGSAAGTA